MGEPSRDFSIVVFPFLKTSDATVIGGYTFRSTDDSTDLSAEQASCVGEIADMLFVQDELRLRSASYAIVPRIDLEIRPFDVDELVDIQAVVAYIYAAPRHEFGDLFLSAEHASMVVFTPGRIPIYTVRPEFHADAVPPERDLAVDERGLIEGYSALYNFRHTFWVAKGSRVYGPKPHLTLNHSQDLFIETSVHIAARADYRLLMEQLSKRRDSARSRVFTAVRWFNSANEEANDDQKAIVHLSIAFETLLGLPVDAKTDRFTDAISLLLGRTPRLDIWARQFYDTRSCVLHEGRARELRFVAGDTTKANSGPRYATLLSYGRRVFQLCLGTILTGVELAEGAGLQENLVTNQERLQELCKILDDNETPPSDRLAACSDIVTAIDRNRHVLENLPIKLLLGAERLAAKTFLEQDAALSSTLRTKLDKLAASHSTQSHLEELSALKDLAELLETEVIDTLPNHEVIRDLTRSTWRYLFMHYFWVKDQPPW